MLKVPTSTSVLLCYFGMRKPLFHKFLVSHCFMALFQQTGSTSWSSASPCGTIFPFTYSTVHAQVHNVISFLNPLFEPALGNAQRLTGPPPCDRCKLVFSVWEILFYHQWRNLLSIVGKKMRKLSNPGQVTVNKFRLGWHSLLTQGGPLDDFQTLD